MAETVTALFLRAVGVSAAVAPACSTSVRQPTGALLQLQSGIPTTIPQKMASVERGKKRATKQALAKLVAAKKRECNQWHAKLASHSLSTKLALEQQRPAVRVATGRQGGQRAPAALRPPVQQPTKHTSTAAAGARGAGARGTSVAATPNDALGQTAQRQGPVAAASKANAAKLAALEQRQVQLRAQLQRQRQKQRQGGQMRGHAPQPHVRAGGATVPTAPGMGVGQVLETLRAKGAGSSASANAHGSGSGAVGPSRTTSAGAASGRKRAVMKDLASVLNDVVCKGSQVLQSVTNPRSASPSPAEAAPSGAAVQAAKALRVRGRGQRGGVAGGGRGLGRGCRGQTLGRGRSASSGYPGTAGLGFPGRGSRGGRGRGVFHAGKAARGRAAAPSRGMHRGPLQRLVKAQARIRDATATKDDKPKPKPKIVTIRQVRYLIVTSQQGKTLKRLPDQVQPPKVKLDIKRGLLDASLPKRIRLNDHTYTMVDGKTYRHVPDRMMSKASLLLKHSVKTLIQEKQRVAKSKQDAKKYCMFYNR